VLLDLTAGVSQASTDAALEQLRTAGIELQGTVSRAG
jgi:nicotinamidase/pyrazinamidase